MAAAVFHHLRTEAEWRQVFDKCYAALRPGGSFWIADLVSFDHPEVQAVMWKRYGDYLSGLKGEAYRDQVFAYIEDEDTPRPLLYQLHLLKEAGFSMVEVLHQNGPFAAFGAVRSVSSH
jgi:tRNA (cmo5U34)-methyltransferase